MKKLVFTAFVVGLGLTANVMAQVPNYVPTNGLVGYWPFNGNANDESGNGNNGTVNGATLTTDRFGNSNKACNFNGTTDFIEVTHNSTLTFSTGVSFSFWLNIPDSSLNSIGLPERQPIGKQVSATVPGIGFETTDATTPVLAAQFYVQGGAQYTDNINLNVNAWIHLVGSYNGTTLKLYKDGVLIGSDTGVFNLLTITENLFFGKEGVLGHYFKGKLDDISVWNRALTQQEITALYQSCSNPVATITPQGSTAFCSGGSLNLTASTGIGYTYQWFRNGTAISNATASSYSATLAGNYTVVISSNGCSSTSAATTVTVNPNPSVTLTGLNSYTNFYTSPITLTGTPSGGTYTGPGVSSNLLNPSIAGLGVNSVNYSYTTAAGCSGNASQSTIVYDTLGVVCTTYDTITTLISVTDTLIINTTLSLPAPNNENTILIYPNPASDHITIDNGNFAAMAGYTIKIENNAGQQVFQSAINQAQFYVDMSTWTGNGLYFVHLIDPQNNTVTVRKIVLQ